MPAVDAVTGEVLSTWSPVDDGHHLASCDTYIAGRVLRVFDHQAPRAILTVSVVLQRESDQARSRTMHNHDRSYVRQRLDVTPKTTEQNRIILTSKSEVEVTNNLKKTALEVLYYWRNEAHYWQTRSTRGLFATAELLVIWNQNI